MLSLYNTRTRQAETFAPLDPAAVRMYVCGPTVYDDPHIGNARPLIVFDLLFRVLRQHYGPAAVRYVRNITDVDDKINARAAAEGAAIGELTARTTARFHEDCRALGLLPPTEEPRATAHIPQMIAMIEALLARGHAYAAEGHVLFAVASDPRYGRLAGRSLDEMIAGARVEVAPYKRDPVDFVLWKPSADGEPGWDSPWGFGRPGWHLECSAMSAHYLGETFDIHGGGIDLVFPHHENEIAQSTCAHGTALMANFWLHNGHVQVEGAKMSKSEGNFVTIRSALDRSGSRGEPLRYAMLMTHYTQPLDWTAQRLSEARTVVGRLAKTAPHRPNLSGDIYPPVLAALHDDLNTPLALMHLEQLRQQIARPGARDAPEHGALVDMLHNSLDLLGFAQIGSFDVNRAVPHNAGFQQWIERLKRRRAEAREARDWAEADRIRDELAAKGVKLMDRRDPATGQVTTTWELAD